MYRAFFGLTDLPFRSTPDLEFFYKDADREQIVSALVYALGRGDGIVKVIGEVGSGKTTLLRMLSQKLSSQYSTVYINTPNLSAHDILFFICVEFGLSVERTEQKYFLTKKLQDFLLNEHRVNRRPIVLIDEAQAMPLETLEEIRLLTNLETEQDKLLQIVLFGQPELDENLSNPEVRQFLSRIAHSISLEPFSQQDVHSYLNFRMRKAGYQGRDVFDFKAAKFIHKTSKGLPRNIHILADKALLSAYSNGDKQILRKHVLDEKPDPSVRHVRWKWAASFLVFFLVFGIFNSKHLIDFLPDHFAKFERELQTSEQTTRAENFVQFDDLNKKMSVSSVDVKSTSSDFQHEKVDSDLNKLVDELENKPSIRYSIQLMTNQLDQLDRVKAELVENRALDAQSLVFVRLPKEEVFVVYYGQYAGFSHATAEIERFPKNIQVGKPFVVSKSQLIAQIKRSIDANSSEVNT